mmetsp:Transcript_57500/g.66414  ORF Transcript_57500/g.66414 Transcript_57500/m.66414 type:complete len:293 (+) Transcript_57500:156-1034(+)
MVGKTKGRKNKTVVRRATTKAKNQIGNDNDTTVASVASNGNANNDDVVAIAISSRTTLFNEETWWMLDLENKSIISTRQGATPLAARCQREYHWDEQKCRNVLKAYRQFLMLKKKFQDWDATILSPSGPVDQMWHQHLLDVTHYYHDTMLLCGHVIGHNPDGADDNASKARRTKTTRDALVEHFGSDYAKEMWLTHAELRTQEENTAADDNDEDPIILKVRDQIGEITSFKMKRSSKISKLLDAYATVKNMPKDDFRFLLDGQRIEDEDLTIAQLEIDHLDRIDVMLTQRGC